MKDVLELQQLGENEEIQAANWWRTITRISTITAAMSTISNNC